MALTPSSLPRLVAAATLTLLAARAEAGAVLPRTIRLVQGVGYNGVVAEIDVAICTNRQVMTQSALVNWGDGATTRGDIVQSSRTPGLFALVSQHTYASIGTYTVTVEVNISCGSYAQPDRMSGSIFDHSSGSVTAVVTTTSETAATPAAPTSELRAVRRALSRMFRPTRATPPAKSRLPLGLDLYRPVPEANRLTSEKIALGRQLFNDRQLSQDGSLSCAGCHDPRHAFTDGRSVAEGIGHARGDRNVPTLVNRAWGASFFWDGRAATLEQQALQPILNPIELAMTPTALLAVARSDRYRRQFVTAFGAEPTIDDVARALASYVRTIVTGDSPYDRYAAGDRSALSTAAQRGLAIFRGKGACSACHSGPTFSDEQFHNTGVAWRTGVLADEGRARVTRADKDRGAFKTPTLREVARTAPYMHDGSFTTLEQVIEYYDGGAQKNPGLDPELRPLHLSPTEKQDLLAFLRALAGDVRDGR